MEGKPWLRGSATEVHGGVDGCTSMVGFHLVWVLVTWVSFR